MGIATQVGGGKAMGMPPQSARNDGEGGRLLGRGWRSGGDRLGQMRRGSER